MMQYGDSGTAYDQMDEFTFDEIARALVYEKTGYVLPRLGSLDPEWQLYRDWLGILKQAACTSNGNALQISIYEGDPKKVWYVQRSDLIQWCESRSLHPRFLFPRPAKLSAGGTSKDKQAKAKSNSTALENWMMKIQAEATDRWNSQRQMGCNPTRRSIKDELAKWCRENGILTGGGINPCADYIYRHVIAKRVWQSPSDRAS